MVVADTVIFQLDVFREIKANAAGRWFEVVSPQGVELHQQLNGDTFPRNDDIFQYDS